jgi:DNA-binding NtrC family response regulator
MSGRILVIDDEADMLQLLERIITDETDHAVSTRTDPEKALSDFRESPFDLVITDLKMPKLGGIRLLDELKTIDPDVSVILMTAYGTIETAVEAIRKGAFDYITKPFRRERILVTVGKAMEWQAIVRENRTLRRTLASRQDLDAMVGSSTGMKEIFERIRQVAPTNGTVTITGESGTGKELVARAVHGLSRRSARQMVTINCTALPENVMESELFGHVKGAFTGAWQDKKGLVAEAHGSTLFLDEIGDLSPTLQTKLLRLLQEGEYKPVGGVATHKADLRIIAATNHDLKADIESKTFREDLYYRLNVIRFHLPPLRERKSDIPRLAYHFLRKYAAINDKPIREISPPAMEALLTHDFPGNVRELENLIERGVIFCRTDALAVRDLWLDSDGGPPAGPVSSDLYDLPFREAKDDAIRRFHRQYIGRLLQNSGGNISRAAETAGIQRQYLHRLMKDAGIEAEGFRGEGGAP